MRRRFLAAGLLALACPGAFAASPQKLQRVLVIAEGVDEVSRQRVPRWFAEEKLAQGRDIAIEFVGLGNLKDPVALEHRVKELLESRPDVVLMETDLYIDRFKRLTSSVPIVLANVCCDDYIARLGWVASLSHPGANITGTAQPVIMDKAYQIAKRLNPRIKRLGVLIDDAGANALGPLMSLMRTDARAAASRLGLEMVEITYPSDAPFEKVERLIREARVEAIDVWTGGEDPTTMHVLKLLERVRIIGLWPDATFVKAGGLLAVHPDLGRGHWEAVKICARILRGTKPADIPIQIIRLTHVAINVTTAKKMGIEVPADVLSAADLSYR